MWRDFKLALSFLTIIPAGAHGDVPPERFARATRAFPMVGLVMGFTLAATEFAAGWVLHPDIAIFMALMALVLINGGFHLDGLADSIDGLAVRGSVERKLEVMKSGAVGPMGVIAIVFCIGLKYLALKSISNLTPFLYYSTLLFMPVMGMWAMHAAMLMGHSARNAGLGHLFITHYKPADFAIATIVTLMLTALPVLLLPELSGGARELYFVAASFIAVCVVIALWVRVCRAGFGGMTGDTIGASGEFGQITYLMAVLAWSRFST